MEKDPNYELPKKPITLDLANLSKDQLSNASIFLGGNQMTAVTLDDTFKYSDVDTVVFRWGDKQAADILAQILEHRVIESKEVLPFSASAVIGDELWHLSVQDKHFNPKTAYASKKQYKEVPFDELLAQEKIHEVSASESKPQLVAKVGSHYLLFEMGLSLNDSIGHESDSFVEAKEVGDFISEEELIEDIEQMILSREFTSFSDQENYEFTLQSTQFILELFGYETKEMGLHYFSSSENNVKGEELPQIIQGLVQDTYRDELYLDADNSVGMRVSDENIPTGRTISRKDELDSKKTAKELREFIKANPDIIEEYKAPQHEVLRQTTVYFEPPDHRGWGLEFCINELGIRTVPFGKRGETKTAAQFALDIQDRAPNEVTKVVCGLAVLCMKHGQRHTTAPFSRSEIEETFTKIFIDKEIE